MKTTKYARKPFYVDAVRVTEENFEDVAQWCGGEIVTGEKGERYIKVRVHRPLTEDQTKAYVGKWVLYAGTGYKCYTAKAFDKSFEKVRTLTKAQADEAGIKVPHEKRQPRVTKQDVVHEHEIAAARAVGDVKQPFVVPARVKDDIDLLLDS